MGTASKRKTLTQSFNRTFMELKFEIVHLQELFERRFNRTFMELKYPEGGARGLINLF